MKTDKINNNKKGVKTCKKGVKSCKKGVKSCKTCKKGVKNCKSCKKEVKSCIKLPNNLSLFNFYSRLLKKKSFSEIKVIIKKYINLINETKSKNDMINLFLLLMNIRNNNNEIEKKIYYYFLYELILDYQILLSSIIYNYIPSYGVFNNIKNIVQECMIDGFILDRFKLLLNLFELLELQIKLYNEFSFVYENSDILSINNITSNLDFILYLRKNIAPNELENINFILSLSEEGLFK